MSCRKYHRRLALYAGEDLTDRQAKRLNRHLERCPDCRQRLDEFRADRDRLVLLAQQTVPGGDDLELRRAVLEKWRREQGQCHVVGHSPRRPGHFLRPVWALAAALVLVLGLIWLVQHKPSPSRQNPGSVAQKNSGVSKGRAAEREGDRRAAEATRPHQGGTSGEPDLAASGPGSRSGGKGRSARAAASRRQSLPPASTRLGGQEASLSAVSHSRPPKGAAAGPVHTITVRLETPDPRVIIYWVIEPGKGAKTL